MIRKFQHFLLFLILLQCSWAYNIFSHVDHKPKLRNIAAEAAAPVIVELSAESPCILGVSWSCSETCKANSNKFTVYWQEEGTQNRFNTSVNYLANYYQIRNLISDRSYTVWVASVKGDVEHLSDSAVSSTDVGEPMKVEGVTANVVSDSVIIVSWEKTKNVCPIKGYFVSWDGQALWDDTLKSNGKLTVSNEDTTTTEVHYLAPYTEYSFYVNEITTDDKNGKPSDEVVNSTKEGAAGPPLSVTSITIDSSTVEVYWSAPTELNGILTGYDISWQILTDPYVPYDNITVEDVDVFNITIDTLLDCGDYTFSVRAINGGGYGEAATTENKTQANPESGFTNFTYKNLNSTSVILTWGPLTTYCSVKAYNLHIEGKVLWGDSIIPYDVRLNDADVDNNTYLLEDLTPWSNYSLSITATTEGSTSNPSFQDFITLQDAAGPPAFLNSSTEGTSSVYLYWSPPVEKNGNIISYHISCKKGIASLIDICRIRTAKDANDYLVEDLDTCGDYIFGVQAINEEDIEGEKVTDNASTDDEPPPSITGFEVSATNSTFITISFNPPETTCDVLHYDVNGVGEIHWSGEVDTYTKRLKGGKKTYELDGLIPWTSYSFNITATTDGGTTGEIDFISETLEDVPSAPDSFVADVLDSSRVNLTWKEPTQLNGEVLLSYNLTYPSLKEPIELDNETVSYTLENLEPCQTYNITLQAINNVGIGPAATQNPKLGPIIPKAVNDLKCKTSGSKTIDLTWSLPLSNCDIEYYQISLSGDIVWGTSSNTSSNISGISGGSYTLTGLIPYTNYTIDLQPATSAGIGPSQLCTCITKEDVPDPPTNQKVKDTSKSKIEIQWQAPLMRNGFLTFFNISLDDKLVGSVPASDDTTKIYSFTLDELEDDVYYSIKIIANNAMGPSAPAPIEVDTDKSHLGAILGTVIPVIVILIAVAGGVWYNKSKKKKKTQINPSD